MMKDGLKKVNRLVPLMADVPRAFMLISRKRGERLVKLASL